MGSFLLHRWLSSVWFFQDGCIGIHQEHFTGELSQHGRAMHSIQTNHISAKGAKQGASSSSVQRAIPWPHSATRSELAWLGQSNSCQLASTRDGSTEKNSLLACHMHHGTHQWLKVSLPQQAKRVQGCIKHQCLASMP